MAAAGRKTAASSVDLDEVARFDALAESWWEPEGPMRPLHRLNPVRLDYIRSRLIRHFGLGARDLRPLSELSVVDVGCGGGILCEPLARLGARVTGIDVSAENVEIARRHAPADLDIDYRLTSAEALAAEGTSFDVLVSMEVIEHVADLAAFVGAAATLVRPGGAAFFATLNRTAKSYLLAIVGAEYVLNWLPRGTHRWNRFVKPAELRRHIEAQGLELAETIGVSFDTISRGWRLSADRGVNYMAYARKV